MEEREHVQQSDQSDVEDSDGNARLVSGIRGWSWLCGLS